MNKKSRFSLQKLLHVRKLVEKERQKELSLSKRRLETEEENLSDLEKKRRQVAHKMSELDHGLVSRFQNHHAYLNTLQNSIEEKKQEIAEIEQDVEKKRQKLLEATKERKMLDKLKEKHSLKQAIAENKTEQTLIDEIATRRSGKP